MFLAEDRILCFELVAKANEKWVSWHVPAVRFACAKLMMNRSLVTFDLL
jgi:cellulose synthase/poly-beta-1,6-N-acetylglucosamine synthase-like glycosyltransferase